MESAALHYFGVHASKLNLPQAAVLAGLVQAPSDYDPYTQHEGRRRPPQHRPGPDAGR